MAPATARRQRCASRHGQRLPPPRDEQFRAAVVRSTSAACVIGAVPSIRSSRTMRASPMSRSRRAASRSRQRASSCRSGGGVVDGSRDQAISRCRDDSEVSATSRP